MRYRRFLPRAREDVDLFRPRTLLPRDFFALERADDRFLTLFLRDAFFPRDLGEEERLAAALVFLTVFLTAFFTVPDLAAMAPTTPPTTVPIGPAILPSVAPATAPAVSLEIDGIWIS